MVRIDEETNIEITRGDILPLSVRAKDKNGEDYTFKVGDVVRFKITEKENEANVILSKDFEVTEEKQSVNVDLTGEETKIGEIINEPSEYWYEIELNPDTAPQTIIGYTMDDGAKLFILLPEGGGEELNSNGNVGG